MTDGIIQEVFNRYSVALVKTSMDKRTYDLLEKELIEKIKQADTKNPDWDSNFSIGVRLMKIYLIGDKQE